jgi:hypothetical protein
MTNMILQDPITSPAILPMLPLFPKGFEELLRPREANEPHPLDAFMNSDAEFTDAEAMFLPTIEVVGQLDEAAAQGTELSLPCVDAASTCLTWMLLDQKFKHLGVIGFQNDLQRHKILRKWYQHSGR